MDFESLQQAGSLLGSAGVIVMDETACMVSAALNLLLSTGLILWEMYALSAKAPGWFVKTLHRIEDGNGRREVSISYLTWSDNIKGKTFCPSGMLP